MKGFYEHPPIFSSPVPDFVDVYVPKGPAYVWLVFEFDGCDFNVEHAGVEEWGEEWSDPESEPEIADPATECETYWRELREGVRGPYRMHGWLKDAIDCDGWDSILPSDWSGGFDSRWIKFMLEEGLGPGQPFLLCIDPPRISKDYWSGEVDVDWDIEIVRVIPQKPKTAAKRWDSALKKRKAFKEAVEKKRARQAEARRRKTDAMYLRSEPFFSSRVSSYDDMVMPDGIRISLWSAHEGGEWLASGSDDDGNHEAALNKLIEKVRKDFPHLPPDICKTLPKRW